MEEKEIAIYQANTDNSMLELVKKDLQDSCSLCDSSLCDSTVIYKNMTIFPCQGKLDFAERVF